MLTNWHFNKNWILQKINYTVSKLIKKEIENLNRIITNMDIESVIKTSQLTNSRLKSFPGEFYQTLKEEYQSFSKPLEYKRGGNTPKFILVGKY